MPILNGWSILSGAVALVGALAWNDAAKASVEAMFPVNKKGGAVMMIAYAIVVTAAMAVLVAAINLASPHVAKFTDRPKKSGILARALRGPKLQFA